MAADLHVAAGVLQDADGRVLIAQRPPGKSMAGAWEFPGGKLLRGETPLQGLVRELREELGIEVRLTRHLARYTHSYPDLHVNLYVWKVLTWSGEPRGVEGQPLRWLPVKQLLAEGLLPADEAIVAALSKDSAVNRCGWEACFASLRAGASRPA